MKMLTIIRTV